MTRDEIIGHLLAIARRLDNRVQIVRTVINADGQVITRISRGSFAAPHDYHPPTLEQLLANVKKHGTD